nr:TetR family transcriptional regulator [Petropleomorpha daqingensis]
MDRRARKKARTREEIRTAARVMFAARGFEAVTIADIAAAADVAVQTVFNHFATKEDLFFDGRTPWVEGAAEAVRSRPASTPPLRALREYLVGTVAALGDPQADEERRSYVATIEASPTLRAREMDIVREAEQRLCAALVEAWSADGADPRPEDPDTVAALIAATWLAAARVLVLSRRTAILSEDDVTADTGTCLATLTGDVLDRLERGFGTLQDLGTLQAPPTSVTGWPVDVARAG